MRARGVEAFGIDVSTFAIQQVYRPIKPFCREASATDDLGGDYDLIVAIEVLEHMAAGEAELAIENICRHTRDVLFSSSPFDYREATHVNVRPPEYWAEQFARRGFYRDMAFDASFVTSWAVRFRKREGPIHRIVADYERGFSLVHVERNELRTHAIATRAELSDMARRLDLAEAELDVLRRAAAEVEALRRAAAELDAVRREHGALQNALADTRGRLDQARATVAAMERSWFWRIRRVWAYVSRCLGRPT